MDVTTETTTSLNDVNYRRDEERRRADMWESKYKKSLQDLRAEYRDDLHSTLTKYSDNEYRLNYLQYQAQMYANLRNMTLGLIIVALLLRLKVISPIISYVAGGLIALVMVAYYWSTKNYNDFTRDGIVFNDFVAKETMDTPNAPGTGGSVSCPANQ